MTNKLPEIGKRYKSNHPGLNYGNIKVMLIDKVLDQYVFKSQYGYNAHSGLKDFFKFFEELPEQSPTTKESLSVEKALQELKKHLALKANELDCETKANFGYITANLAQNLINALDDCTIPENLAKNMTINKHATRDEVNAWNRACGWPEIKEEKSPLPERVDSSRIDGITAETWKMMGRGDYFSSSEYARKKQSEKDIEVEEFYLRTTPVKSIWKDVSELGLCLVGDTFVVGDKYCKANDFINEHNQLLADVDLLDKKVKKIEEENSYFHSRLMKLEEDGL